MTKCFSCGDVLIKEYDEEGTPLNFWTNLHGDVYCDQCYYELYTVPSEKAFDEQSHDDKRVRAKAEKKLKQLQEIWGTY